MKKSWLIIVVTLQVFAALYLLHNLVVWIDSFITWRNAAFVSDDIYEKFLTTYTLRVIFSSVSLAALLSSIILSIITLVKQLSPSFNAWLEKRKQAREKSRDERRKAKIARLENELKDLKDE